MDAEPSSVLAFWRLICDTFRKIVDSKYFGRGIMIAILVNTLSMGIEYHEQVGLRAGPAAHRLRSGVPPGLWLHGGGEGGCGDGARLQSVQVPAGAALSWRASQRRQAF